MSTLEKFQKLLDENGIKYFKASEVLYLGDSNGELKVNSIPPESLWKNIIPTVKVADKLREKVGRIRISSGYRKQEYNSKVGGEKNSFHTKFVALDLVPLDSKPSALLKAAKDLRSQGVFKGGVGGYKTFVHVDTRGYNATW